MLLYSDRIIRFVREVSAEAKRILSNELGMRIAGPYVYDRQGRFGYRLSVVVFNDRPQLGYFDKEFMELGLHQRLMTASQDLLLNTIRHELAHFMVYLEYGDSVAAHGPEFRQFCLDQGWGDEVFRASAILETQEEVAADPRVLQKVKKLLALSSSNNAHEAEQAMVKAREVLLKHNMSEADLDYPDVDEAFWVLKRVCKRARRDAKMQAIASILQTFFVSVVFSRAGSHSYLEILGSETNVHIADYVASFLDTELDKLWKQARVKHLLKGMVAKNSFLTGIALGYCDKVKKTEPEADTASQALLLLEQQLERARKLAYPSLSKSAGRQRYCPESAALGQAAGKALSIHPGVTQSSNAAPKLLH